MKPLLSLKTMLALSLLVGLCLGYLLQSQSNGTLERQIWVATVQINIEKPPVIHSLRLINGVAGPVGTGDSTIQLLDSDGKVLYSNNFSSKIVSGDLEITQKTLVMALPYLAQANTCLVRTPKGETKYDLAR